MYIEPINHNFVLALAQELSMPFGALHKNAMAVQFCILNSTYKLIIWVKPNRGAVDFTIVDTVYDTSKKIDRECIVAQVSYEHVDFVMPYTFDNCDIRRVSMTPDMVKYLAFALIDSIQVK